jgi:hypothetical protein
MTSGQMRADRIIEREMLRAGDEMRQARSFEAWSVAHLELEELGKALDLVHGKRLKDAPSLTAELFGAKNSL